MIMTIGRRSSKKMTILRTNISLVATASSSRCFSPTTAAATATAFVSKSNMNNVSLQLQPHYCHARSKQYHHYHHHHHHFLQFVGTNTLNHRRYSTSDDDDDDNYNDSPVKNNVYYYYYYYYRLLYFNSRGSAEVLRYYMHIHNIPFQDVRYPITATSQGFGTTEIFRQHQFDGVFNSNMGKLPILQIIQQQQQQQQNSKEKHGSSNDNDNNNNSNNNEEKIVASIGQTHAILRYLDSTTTQVSNKTTPDDDDDDTDTDCDATSSSSSLRIVQQQAYIDSFVECIRDVKSAWFQAKKQGRKQDFMKRGLKEWCVKLENSLPEKNDTNNDSSSSSSPWLFGSNDGSATSNAISVADIALYAMMSTSTSIRTGSTQSFFDNATYEEIQTCLENCPRLTKSIQATSQLKQVQQYELNRPDTFS